MPAREVEGTLYYLLTKNSVSVVRDVATPFDVLKKDVRALSLVDDFIQNHQFTPHNIFIWYSLSYCVCAQFKIIKPDLQMYWNLSGFYPNT